MNIFIYCVIGIIGVLFGSFFTLSVYRIPRGEDITHTRSYCPKCEHKLGFFDLIPVLSYIFLGGKCRYCKETISKRYILFEIFTGILFILLALTMGINVSNLIIRLPELVYNILFLAIIIMIIGMAKEANHINVTTILFGILFRTIYLAFFDLEMFKISFLQTAELLLICLIVYTIMAMLKVNETRFENFLELALLVSFIAYNFGLMITTCTMLLALISKILNKFICRIKINPAVYIGIITICILLTKNIDFLSNIYENISGWIIWKKEVIQ